MTISSLAEQEREVVLQLVGLFWGCCSISKSQEKEFNGDVRKLAAKLHREKDTDENSGNADE
jgi:hypothetical protein